MPLTISADAVKLIWAVIDRLPQNLGDYDRDSFGLANLLVTVGAEITPIEDPFGPVEVTSLPAR